MSTHNQRIAELARRSPQMAFTSLNQHLTVELLQEAYRRTRKDGATGVDGQTAAAYEADLDANLRSLLERAKSGRYRAPPVRRVRIPKGDGQGSRPIGIPTLEDKVLQRAVAMILEPIYEQEFLNFSYGFRPGRSAHQALDALWHQNRSLGGGWVLDVDVASYFDTIDHGHLRQLIQRRVRDGVVLRLIGKWLNAGVLEDGVVWHPEAGTPQGGVISPLLANIYLHYVLDAWFEQEVRPRLKGRAWLVRFADDFVAGFEHKADAERVLGVLPKRFGKYGLTIHPAKTRMVEFTPARGRERAPGSKPGTFTFLGFTHYWGRSRRGRPTVKRKTESKRQSRAIRRIADWCRANRHGPIPKQHARLSAMMRGHYAYYGITGNYPAMRSFQQAATRCWRTWLSRRSWAGTLSWAEFRRILEHFPLPPPKVVHSACRR